MDVKPYFAMAGFNLFGVGSIGVPSSWKLLGAEQSKVAQEKALSQMAAAGYSIDFRIGQRFTLVPNSSRVAANMVLSLRVVDELPFRRSDLTLADDGLLPKQVTAYF